MKKGNIGAYILIIALLGFLVAGSSMNVTSSGEKAIAISGHYTDSYPEYWGGIRDATASRFTDWGYETWTVHAPSKAQYEAHIKDSSCSYCFAMAHGGSTSFGIQKGISIRASDIENWMANRNKMTFAFLGHCNAMDNTGPGTLSYAYRKGSTTNTVTIGFTNFPSGGAPYFGWTQKLFETADTGVTWKEAFDHANECYPICASYTKFVGDKSLTINPLIALPDLRVEDIWIDGPRIHYEIKNYGDADADYSFTGLKVNGQFIDFWKTPPVSRGEITGGAFGFYEWMCTGERDTIVVIADYPPGRIEESNEDNNGMTKIFTCDDNSGGNCIGIDFVPIEIFEQYGRVAMKIKNQGTVTSPSVYLAHYVYLKPPGNYPWQYYGKSRGGQQAPGTIRTMRSDVSWPSAGMEIKVRANGNNAFTECNMENNEMIVTA